MSLARTMNRKSEFPIGITLILIFTIFFMARFINIALSRNIMGNHSYVQIINSGMPIIKSGYYDKDAYLESNVNVEALILETFWLNEIDIGALLSFSIPGFTEFENNSNLVKNDEGIGSFTVADTSIEKEQEVEKGEARNPNIVKTLDQTKPEVLIYSSHTAEAFVESDNGVNNDVKKNILGVGELIEKELEEYYGISVVHDKTMYAADYNSAYKRSREGFKKYLDKYGDFKFAVDLHRDGGPKRENVTTNMNGEDVARLMFVTGRNNPNHSHSMKVIERMTEDMNKYFPGLSRGSTIYNNASDRSYGQDLLKNAFLMEVGSEKSKTQDAMNSAKYIARLIAEEIYRQDNEN